MIDRIKSFFEKFVAKKSEQQMGGLQYATTLQALPDLLFVVDQFYRIVEYHAPKEEMLYSSPESFLGKPFADILPAHASSVVFDSLERAMKNGCDRGAIYFLDMPQGRRWYELSVTLEKSKGKYGVRFVALARDISERKLAEQREKQARNEAETANKAKDLFLATLSHELRTPLTSILATVQLLRMKKVDSKTSERCLELLEDNSKTLRQLIDDLLDISRIQAGKIELNIQKIDPQEMIHSALNSLSLSKPIQIETIIDPSIPSIDADPVRLQQVLWNLITNSIKFTGESGRIWITVKSIPSYSGQQVQIQVRDNGRGIRPTFLPLIFETFTQENHPNEQQHRGLGLGLAIVRKLIELHGGTINAESEGLNQGATFTILIPASQ